MALTNLNSGELSSVASVLSEPADKFGNDEALEFHWAIRAFHHAETYFNLLISVDPKLLKLTKIDDEIYAQFREEFGDYKIDLLDEKEMKSEEGKAKWRPFLSSFEGKVEDWNMGTLIRIDCTEDITDKNTMLVPRIQFLAIEIARNREGLNSGLKPKFRPNKIPPNS